MPAPEPAVCEDEVTAGPGGAMTDEAGVITGDLIVRTTRLAGNQAAVTVQYAGAEEWYVLAGSPVAVAEGGLEDYHERVLTAVEQGNEAVAPT